MTKLGLISVGDPTSGTAPATLTFAGIDSLLLATQNGSITLGSNLAFEGIPTLFIYARGTGKLLTFDSTVSGSTNLVLLSQGSILFNNAFDVTESDPAGSSLNVYFDAGKNLTATNGLTLTLDNSVGGNLSGFADISISAGGNVVANGETGLSLRSRTMTAARSNPAPTSVFSRKAISPRARSIFLSITATAVRSERSPIFRSRSAAP